MGSYLPHLKIQNKSTVYYNVFFLQIIFYNSGLYSNIDKQTRVCLGTFEYIEADREMYRKWNTKSKEYSTTLHVSFRLFYIFVYHSTLCYAPHVTEPHKKKSILHGGYYGVHLTPSENKHK